MVLIINLLKEVIFLKGFKVDLLKASNPTIAEFSKVMDNLWIDLNISLANELYKITNKIGVDALEIIKLANTLKKEMAM